MKKHIFPEETSLALDFLRIFAAITVLIVHVSFLWFDSKVNFEIGHLAVIVFFVLSGFIIAYTISNNLQTFDTYLVLRVSRLMSIALPAIFITALIEIYLSFQGGSIIAMYTRGNSFIRYLLSAVFLNEIWFISAAPPINTPLWSLSYEFWYYLLFGLYCFKKENKSFKILSILFGLIVGPKVLLMFPIWFMGVLSFETSKYRENFKYGFVLFLFFLIILLIIAAYLPPMPFSLGKYPLYFSNQFITDYILGGIIAWALWVLPKQSYKAISNTKFICYLRKIGDLTFSLYVLHYPFLVLYISIFSVEKGDVSSFVLCISVIVAICLVIGFFLESKRFWWKKNIDKALSKYLKIFAKDEYPAVLP
nr:acyltransferase [uncultured Arsenicibacter sp.]